MGRRKKSTGAQLELPLGLPAQQGTDAPSELWSSVEAYPGKVTRSHRERHKLVRKKMHQVDVEQLLAEPPHLTQEQRDLLDELVVFSPD